MRILAGGNVYVLNEHLYEAPRPADDWLGKPSELSTKPGMRCARSARRKRLKLHLAKNFLRRMPSNTINSFRKSEEIVRKKGPVQWTRGLRRPLSPGRLTVVQKKSLMGHVIRGTAD
jgi:hypothetical protein